MHSIAYNAEENAYEINLTRGDSLYLEISATKDGEPYVPQQGDVIRFAMKQKYKDDDSQVKINKQVPLDTMILEIEPEDTKHLQQNKTYVFDIELTAANGDVDTFIEGTITLTNEVI